MVLVLSIRFCVKEQCALYFSRENNIFDFATNIHELIWMFLPGTIIYVNLSKGEHVCFQIYIFTRKYE
jgi:hypothetical protein